MSDFVINKFDKSIKVKLRNSKIQDWVTVWSWIKEAGWTNVGRETGFIAYRLPHITQLVAVDEEDEPLSYISFFEDNQNAFVNVYITERHYRGLGIGKALWTEAMKRLNKCTNVGIASHEEMIKKYSESFGFQMRSPVSFHRMKGRVNGVELEHFLTDDFHVNYEILSIQNDKDIERVIKFDQQVVGFDRSEFLWQWFRCGRITASQPHPAIINVCAVDDNHNVVGYGSASPGLNVLKVGPLYAKEDQIALHLVNELLKTYNATAASVEEIVFNVPSTNTTMIDVLEKSGLKDIFHLEVAYTTNLPEIYYKWIYSVSCHVCQIT